MAFTQATSIFNIAPEGGHAAEFGFRYVDRVIKLYADLAHTAEGYRLRVTVPGIQLLGVYYSRLTLFGRPGPHDGEAGNTAAFITNPARCTGQPLNAKIEVNPGKTQATGSPGKPSPTPSSVAATSSSSAPTCSCSPTAPRPTAPPA